MSIKQKTSTDLPTLLEGAGEGRTCKLLARFGSDPSGPAKASIFCRNPSNKAVLSSKVIVNICQKRKIA